MSLGMTPTFCRPRSSLKLLRVGYFYYSSKGQKAMPIWQLFGETFLPQWVWPLQSAIDIVSGMCCAGVRALRRFEVFSGGISVCEPSDALFY